MAEYTRGQDRRGSEGSGYNKKERESLHRLSGVDFEELNFEQRRAPYKSNSTRSVESAKEVGDSNNPNTRSVDL